MEDGMEFFLKKCVMCEKLISPTYGYIVIVQLYKKTFEGAVEGRYRQKHAQ